ncbi:hypothetical protein HK096_005134, partial [Nowakowskiella sp. JEL0078]
MQNNSEVVEKEEVVEEEIIPCENFNMTCQGVYRSAFPKKKNFSFLKKLGLKSILTLILEDYPEQNMKFLEENNIKLFQFGVAGNKEPFVDIPEETICAALTAMLGVIFESIERIFPGKHRTGCLIGCIRKLQHWSLTSIFDEYRRFSHPKSRSMDLQFIELFDVSKVVFDPRFLPDWPELSFGTMVILPKQISSRSEIKGVDYVNGSDINKTNFNEHDPEEKNLNSKESDNNEVPEVQ